MKTLIQMSYVLSKHCLCYFKFTELSHHCCPNELKICELAGVPGIAAFIEILQLIMCSQKFERNFPTLVLLLFELLGLNWSLYKAFL